MTPNPSPKPFFQRLDVLLFALAWAILTGRLLYQVTYFPAFLAGEECRMIDVCGVIRGAAEYRGSWLQAFWESVPEYNKGYAWFALPFYLQYGYDLRIFFILVPVFVGLWGAYLFFTYRKSANAPAASLWSFLLVASFTLLALSVRRYKWHTMCYPGAISVYLYFVPDLIRGLPRRTVLALRCASIGIFAVASFFYFGNIIYTVPFFLLVVYVAVVERRKTALWFSGIFAVSVVLLQVIAYRTSPLWAHDINVSVERIRGFLAPEQLAQRWETVGFFFHAYMTPAFTILLALGVGVSLVRGFRGDKFSVINLAFLFWLLGMQYLMWGINNVDCLNWSMIPMLSVLLIGAEFVRERLSAAWRYGNVAFAVLAVGLAVYEIQHFPEANKRTLQQGTIDVDNTTTQVALAFRLISENEEPQVRFFLPSPKIATADGGFEYENTAKRADLKAAYEKVTYFDSFEQLDGELANLAPGHSAVVFLSVLRPENPLANPPRGRLADRAATVLTPYEDVYRAKIPLRVFRVGAANAP